MINFSKARSLEPFNGQVVRLSADDPRVPFHGAFLIHEMRVRGHWPFANDRPIPWPLETRRARIHDDHHFVNGNGDGNDGLQSDMNTPVALTPHATLRQLDQQQCPRQASHASQASQANPTPHRTMTLSNPFSNLIELEALKHSFAEQPNWKAAVVEGESWEGTAEENIAKYLGNVVT
jgi:hypothetical protein